MDVEHRRGKDAAQLATAREIVERHPLPDFITGFEIRLGFMDGEPAIFVVYREAPNEHEPRIDEVFRRSEVYGRLDREILDELLDAIEDRTPYSLVTESGVPSTS